MPGGSSFQFGKPGLVNTEDKERDFCEFTVRHLKGASLCEQESRLWKRSRIWEMMQRPL